MSFEEITGPGYLPIRIERDIVLAQKGKQLLLAASRNRVVVSLVQAGFGIALSLAYVDERLHFRGTVIGESEPPVFSLSDAVIHGLRHILEGRLAIRNMKIHRLYGGNLEGLERLRNALRNLGRLVGSGRAVAHLRMDGEPRRGPNLSEAFLRAFVVGACIEFPPATAVECIQESLYIFEIVKVYSCGTPGGIANLPTID